MVEQREFKRVMAIVRAHARDAMSKHDTQRESFLAYCRNNWKRYAAGFTKNPGECDRFAATLERATRDLIVLADAAPNKDAVVQILYGEQPPAWADRIEGAMDSVVMYEAHQQPELTPEPIAATPAATAAGPSSDTASPAPAPLQRAIPAEASEHHSAEAEDRLSARYGFRSPAAEESPAPAPELPEHAKDLQRKVRAVLLAHRTNKS
jgi:hypothetical protein